MKTILLIFALALPCVGFAQQLTDETQASIIVNRYAEWFTRDVGSRLKRRALSVTPIIVDKARKYRLDPLVVAVLMSLESSYSQDARGKLGEVGLMQVHNSAIREEYGDALETVEGNIDAGFKVLRMCLDKCGSESGMIACYGTGNCDANKVWVKMRVRKIEEARNNVR